MTPTMTQAQAFSALFDYFNSELFGGELSPCLLNFSRKSKAYGFFAPERWASEDGQPVHEISLNPSYMAERSPEEFLSTLVHEMCHLWQREFGKPGKRGYHNKEFARKMAEVGLICSNTGKPGGKGTGVQMTHYIDTDGAFQEALQGAPDHLPLMCQEVTSAGRTKRLKASNKSKTKYTCQGCEFNAWAKPGALLGCWTCQLEMIEA